MIECYPMKKQLKQLQFKVLVEEEDGVYVASVPELPGCYTQGKTLEQVRNRIKEAIQLVLESDEDLKEEKLKSPSSSNFFGVGLLRKILRDANISRVEFEKLKF